MQALRERGEKDRDSSLLVRTTASGIVHASLAVIMSHRKNVRCYGYVERPYEQVRALLHREPLELLQRATNSASLRTRELIANLKVDIGGFEIGVDIRAHVNRVREEDGVAGLSPVTRVELAWEAARARSSSR